MRLDQAHIATASAELPRDMITLQLQLQAPEEPWQPNYLYMERVHFFPSFISTSLFWLCSGKLYPTPYWECFAITVPPYHDRLSLNKPVAISGIKLIHKRIAACCQQKFLPVPNVPLVPVPCHSSADVSMLPRICARLSYQRWVLTRQDTAQPHRDPNLGPGSNTALSAML